MANSNGPTELPYFALMAKLARAGEAAFEFEAECEAYDTAPEQHRGELADVDLAHQRVDGELHALVHEIEGVREKYRRWLTNAADKNNERRSR